MSITVRDLINKYQSSEIVTESESNYSPDFKLDSEITELNAEELKVLSALNMGVTVEKVLKARRIARNS